MPIISRAFGKRRASRVATLRAVQVGLLAVYLLAVAAILPVHRLGTWPLLRHDYSYHYAQVVEVNELLAEQGRLWGYSDRFAAGYLIGVGSTLSSTAWVLFVHLLSHLSVSTTLAFNLYPVLWLILTPLLIYQSCRRFGLPLPDATLATVAAMIYWWSSTLYWYFRIGLISFLAIVPLSMFAIASLFAFVREGRWRWLAAFALATAVCGWVHPLSAVFVVVGYTAVYLLGIHRLSLAQHMAMLAASALTLAAQWPWVAPHLATRDWLRAPQIDVPYFQPEGLAVWASGVVNCHPQLGLAVGACLLGAAAAAWLWHRDRLTAGLFLAGPPLLLVIGLLIGTPLHRLLLLGSLAGMAVWWRSDRRSLALVFGAVSAVLIYLAHAGEALAALQPGRNVGVAFLWLAIPTAAAVQRLAHYFREHGLGVPIGAMAVVLLALGLWPIVEPEIAERFVLEPITAIQPPSQEMDTLVAWLVTYTTTEGRVLFEDSLRLPATYDITVGYLANASGRSFIGGPFPWGGPVDFVEGRPFLQPIEQITAPEMAHLISLYNIHWVCVHTPAARAYFDAQTELVELQDDLGFVRAYRVRQPATYFLEGSGRIAVHDHQLDLWDLDGSTVIVKYHWVPGLQATSGTRLEPASIPPDPYGFIRIVAPPERLSIQLRGAKRGVTP